MKDINPIRLGEGDGIGVEADGFAIEGHGIALPEGVGLG